MAYAHVQTKVQSPTAMTTATTTTTSAETFASTPAVGNLVVVYIGYGVNAAGDNLTSVTDNQTPSNTYTIAKSQVVAGTATAGAGVAYAILARATGTFTVTAHFGVTMAATAIAISEFSGNASSAPVDGTNSGTGASTAPAGGSVTPTQSGDLFIAVESDDNGAQTYTVPTGYSARAQDPNGIQGTDAASLISANAAAQSSTFAMTTSANWAAVIVAFKAAGTALTPQDFGMTLRGRPFPGWNPERSAVAMSLTPAQATVPPLNGPAKATVLPDWFARPNWNPELTHIARAGWTQATWAIPPKKIPEPVLPERRLTPWTPPSEQYVFKDSKLPVTLIVPTWGYEVYGPHGFSRWNWNPERSESARAAWIQSLWAVPPQGWLPVYPDRPFPTWSPDKSAICFPVRVAAAVGGGTVYAIFVFDD